jgi:hypothetical protein
VLGHERHLGRCYVFLAVLINVFLSFTHENSGSPSWRAKSKGKSMAMDTEQLTTEVGELREAMEVQAATQAGTQATEAATQAGAQATQAAVQAGAAATQAAGLAGLASSVISGAVGLIVGMFLGLAIGRRG